MMHYLQNRTGDIKYTVDMQCGHPDMKGNTTASVGCDGKCEKCTFGVARLTLPDFYKIMKYAKLDFIQ